MLARNDLRLLLALPPATALLVLSNLLAHANAHALPRQTTTVPYRELDVLPYPPLPTAAPLSPFERLKRQEENTICGYISGDPDLPATCSAGSHCVVAQGLGVIGCCPNGDGPCTAGIFTGCVDANSGPQTEVNPYIYSCTGSDVCYRNVFAGGNFQYGCGSASNIGGTVAATASGRSIALPIPSVSAPLTASPSFLSRATILGTISRSGDDTSSLISTTTSASTTFISRSTASSSSSSSSSSPTDPSNSATPSADPSTEAPDASTSGGVNKTGAIIGGSVSGAAVLLGVLAVVFFWRRRRQNKREGPGLSKTTHYISNPMGGGPDFAPVAPSQEAYDQGYASHGPYEHAPDCPLSRGLDAPFHHAADCPLAKAVPGSTLRSAFPAHPFTYGPGGEIVPTRGSGGIPIRNDSSGMFGVSRTADDQVPLNHDYQDFTRGFSDGLSRIDEEGSRPTTAAHGSSRNGFI